MAVEDFTEGTEGWDFDAWIEQGGRPQRTVMVYSAWRLYDKLRELEKAIAAAEQDDDPSLGDVGTEELREEHRELAAELEASGKPFTVRSLSNEEIATVTAGVPEKLHKYRDSKGVEQERWQPDRIAIGDALVAEATVEPRLTRDQVTKMRRRIGDGPMQILIDTVNELREAGSVLPEVPTLPGHSDSTRD